VARRDFLLHWFRRLRIRREIRDDIHEAFMTLAAAIICWRRLSGQLGQVRRAARAKMIPSGVGVPGPKSCRS
jgi:hypothetical protein